MGIFFSGAAESQRVLDAQADLEQRRKPPLGAPVLVRVDPLPAVASTFTNLQRRHRHGHHHLLRRRKTKVNFRELGKTKIFVRTLTDVINQYTQA